MTGFLTLAAILWAVTIAGGIALLHRALAESCDRPSLRHRHEQGSGDVRGEGLFLTNHNSGDTHVG